MAVYVAFADESDGPFQKGPFLFGGFVASHRYWEQKFTPDWEARVMNATPPIPYLHTSEIRMLDEQNRLGIDHLEYESRIHTG